MINDTNIYSRTIPHFDDNILYSLRKLYREWNDHSMLLINSGRVREVEPLSLKSYKKDNNGELIDLYDVYLSRKLR